MQAKRRRHLLHHLGLHLRLLLLEPQEILLTLVLAVIRHVQREH